MQFFTAKQKTKISNELSRDKILFSNIKLVFSFSPGSFQLHVIFFYAFIYWVLLYDYWTLSHVCLIRITLLPSGIEKKADVVLGSTRVIKLFHYQSGCMCNDMQMKFSVLCMRAAQDLKYIVWEVFFWQWDSILGGVLWVWESVY